MKDVINHKVRTVIVALAATAVGSTVNAVGIRCVHWVAACNKRVIFTTGSDGHEKCQEDQATHV